MVTKKTHESEGKSCYKAAGLLNDLCTDTSEGEGGK